MVFAIILIVLIGVVAFFHYIQGFFSAALSAIFTVIAAAVAVGYHENVVQMIKPGKFADSSSAVVLSALFALTYLALRIIFDRVVSGNVRLLPTIDKVGAGLMGVIAGLFAAGIVAIAAQTMPFGPSVLGYSRYALAPDREVNFQTKPNAIAITRTVSDETKDASLDKAEANHLLVPVDDIVLGTVSTLSDGALSGAHKFSDIHEDYLKEAFGNRIGIELGAKLTTTNFEGSEQVTVDKVGMARELKAVEDSEIVQIRGNKESKKPQGEATGPEARLGRPLKPEGNKVILIVRTKISADATDKDSNFRFSPGSIRLVGHDPETGKARDYFPIGTMDTWGGGTVWPSQISDPLVANLKANKGVDFVFVVEHDDVLDSAAPVAAPKKAGDERPAPAAAAGTFKAGTFLEVKRLGRADLSRKAVEPKALAPDPAFDILRKSRLKAPPEAA